MGRLKEHSIDLLFDQMQYLY